LVPIGQLKAHSRNARVHPASQVDDFATTIRRVGFIDPVVIDEGNLILSGHVL
jgi:ParB-like chromosome segregation protein Spo0J